MLILRITISRVYGINKDYLGHSGKIDYLMRSFAGATTDPCCHFFQLDSFFLEFQSKKRKKKEWMEHIRGNLSACLLGSIQFVAQFQQNNDKRLSFARQLPTRTSFVCGRTPSGFVRPVIALRDLMWQEIGYLHVRSHRMCLISSGHSEAFSTTYQD